MNRLFETARKMLRDNRRRHGLLGLATVAGAVVAVACAVALMYPAHAITGGDTLRNAINEDSTVFCRPAGADDGSWGKTDGGSAVAATSELRLRLAFTLPAGTLAKGTTLQYRVPTSVHPDTSTGAVKGDVFAGPTAGDPSRSGANAIGSYSLDGDVLTLSFNEDVALANAGSVESDSAESAAAEAKTARTLSGYVDLDLGFDQLTCNDDGLAAIKLNDSVSLKVAKAAEETASVESADADAATASVETGEDEESTAPSTSRLAKAAPAATLEAAADGDGFDLAQFINKPVKVQKKNEDGTYADPVTEFTAGDNVKTTIYYQIPAGILSKDNHVVTYQIPNGLKPTEALTHKPIVLNKVTLGYYTVTTDGIVTLDFNDTAIEGGTITGSFFFQGIVSNVGDGESTEVNFGGSGGSITVKKKQESGGGEDTDHDIKVEKKASKSEDDSKIYYTVTVSTEKGTPSTVDITDCLNKWNSSNATPAYEKSTLQLKKVFSNGSKQTLGNYAAWNDNGNDGPTFSLSNLPQLSAGEKYELTYTVDSHAAVTSSGAAVANRASATSGGKTGESWQHVYYQQDAKKWGSYDPKTDHVIWTVEVNPNGKDVSNWTVHDTLPNGTKLTQQYIVRDANNKEYGRFGSAGNSEVNFSFSQLRLTDAQKTQKYYIDIYTDAPSSDMEKLENKATTTTTTGTVESVGATPVTHRTTEVKKDHKTDAAASEKGAGIRKETWAPTITLPGGALSSFTYTDTIADATDGNGVGLGAGSHYAIAAELDKVFGSSVQDAAVDATTGLFINVDGYSKYLYRGNGKAYYDDYWATQDGSKGDVSFTVTYYDGPDGTGNVVDATDTTTHVKSFTVRVDITGSNVKAFDMRTGEYPTYLDTTKVGEGASITALNKGKAGVSSVTSNFTYTRPHRILKAVRTGEHTYTSSDATLDFGNIQDGKLTYRIALTTESSDNGEDIVVTDVLPGGMTYVDGSATARFDEYYDDGTFSGDKAPQVTSASTDGGTELTFTIPNYQYRADRPTFYLYYDVSIKSDPSWNNGSTSKTYENKATWGRSESTQRTEVDRTYEKVSKSGEQLYDESGEPTGNLRYYVEINAAAQDLDPNSDVLTLTDEFNSGSVDSDLDPTSIKLYAYDYSKEHHYDPARPIENFKASYEAKTHTITVEVPDKCACVLTYEYTLDSSFGSITVTNSASLNGRFSKSGSIKLKEASAGADIHQGRFVLYKVDADDISKTLPGVEFKLSYWDGGTWVDKSTVNPLVTDSQGSITYDYEKNLDGLQPNTLYRLAETKGKDGYARDAERFFIVKNIPDAGSPISDDAAFSAANAGNATNKSGGTLTAADVNFFKDNKTNAMYVTNEYTRLTAKKSWTDENGVAKDAPAGSSARLALYRYTKRVDTDNSVNVTVTAMGNQSSWSKETKLTGTGVSDGTVAIKKGSDFTFNVGGLWGGCTFDVYVNDQKYGDTHSFTSNDPVAVTISSVTADTKIEVKQNVGNDVTLTEDSNNPWAEPPQILDDATGKKVGESEVSASTGWAASWDNLPKQVGGEDVYYAVKELSYTVNGTTYTPGDGSYDVSYINDGGVQTGIITVTNSEKENHGYELPATGGTPSPLPWVGGALAALAAVLLAWRMRPRKN